MMHLISLLTGRRQMSTTILLLIMFEKLLYTSFLRERTRYIATCMWKIWYLLSGAEFRAASFV